MHLRSNRNYIFMLEHKLLCIYASIRIAENLGLPLPRFPATIYAYDMVVFVHSVVDNAGESESALFC